MNAQVIRMTFNTGLHTGRRGIGLEESDHRLTADTLFSALINQLALRDTDLINPIIQTFPRMTNGEFFPGDVPFLLSSSFPFAGEILLFPVPLMTFNTGEGKTVKKVKYVSQAIFSALLDGHDLSAFEAGAIKLQDNTVWVTNDEKADLPVEIRHDLEVEQDKSPRPHVWRKLWYTERRPRVAIDRMTHRSNIFHHGQTLYREGCGLWFAVHWRRPELRVGQYSLRFIFDLLLDDLTVFGVGGLRSYGLGAFTVVQSQDLNLPEYSAAAVQLSRFYPSPSDTQYFNLPGTSYRLIHVEGANVREYAREFRRSLTMIEEGAVMAGNMIGCLVNLAQPGHPHERWRYGLSFPVGLRN